MTTQMHVARLYGEEFTMEANWEEASSNVSLNGAPTQWQVADFSHRHKAGMRAILEKFVMECGDDPDDPEFTKEIAVALEHMQPVYADAE